MDLRKLKTLVDLVSESNISELEITETDGKVRIVKAVPGLLQAAAPMMMQQPVMAAPAAPLSADAAPTAALAAPEDD